MGWGRLLPLLQPLSDGLQLLSGVQRLMDLHSARRSW